MIKINLAKRKQSKLVGGDSTSSLSSLQSLFSRPASRSDSPQASGLLSDTAFRKLVLSVLVGFGANYLWTDYKTEEFNRISAQETVINQQMSQLRKQLLQRKKLDQLKTALEADEKLIQTKLDVVQELISGRSSSFNILKALSSSFPRNSWATEVEFSEEIFSLKGRSTNYQDISELMEKLGSFGFLSGMELVSSQQVRLENGTEVTSYELKASKKK